MNNADKNGFQDVELLEMILQKTPLIDVRAPIEYSLGKIPGAVNIPLLDDDQRAEVGTAYKKQGADAALSLGYKLINPEVREIRLRAWRTYAQQYPNAKVYCFRGGLRSQLTVKALAETGLQLPIISGGFKRFRSFAMSQIESASKNESFLNVSGFTGSGKTDFLRKISSRFRICDLEKAAHHRGSSFGAFQSGQATQVDFEHELAAEFVRTKTHGAGCILIEDESRLIGRNVIPSSLFKRISTAPMIVLERPRTERAHYLIKTYLFDTYGLTDGFIDPNILSRLRNDLNTSLTGIERRLGGATFKVMLSEINDALAAHEKTGKIEAHFNWVEKILEVYYDPLYLHHISKQTERIIARGSENELLNFLENRTSGHSE